MKKSFLVTGLSNSLGGHEDHLIRDDCTRREIEEVITEVFGEEAMGFKPQDDQSDHDPFDSDDSSSEKLDTHSEPDIDDIDLDRETKSDSIMCSPRFQISIQYWLRSLKTFLKMTTLANNVHHVL